MTQVTEVVPQSEPEIDMSLPASRSTPERIASGVLNRLLRIPTITSAILQDEMHPLSRINRWHGTLSLLRMEGFMLKEQAKFMSELLTHMTKIKNIAEIGFNGGQSSAVFLETRPDITVTSFDIAEHNYVEDAASYLSSRFPDRHQLIKGDSTQTVPQFSATNPNQRFDLIFIDGNHRYPVVSADLRNMHALAHRDTVLIMDDYMSHARWGEGPIKAWDEAVCRGLVAQDSISSGDRRTWAVGQYLHT